MTTRQVNVPLLRKAVEWAETEAAKPEIDREWVQGGWLSTPISVALEALDGTPYGDDYFVRRDTAAAIAEHCGTAYCIAGYVGQALDARYAKSEYVDDVHVAEFAADALGISPRDPLFDAGNSIEDVRQRAEALAGERL